jgi:hypothetical protein
LIDPDELNRTQKLVLDEGEARTTAEAEAILRSYVAQMAVSTKGLEGITAEAAFATVANAAPRAFQGGLHVLLESDERLQYGWAAGRRASEIIRAYGGTTCDSLRRDLPTLVLGEPDIELPQLTVRLAHSGWAAGITIGETLWRGPECPLAGVLAAAAGVGECFQARRGNVRAGRRDHGLSLWRPDLDWLDPSASGPPLGDLLAPSRLHVVGLGHLGQAYAWAVGWLPVEKPDAVELLLQDVDVVTPGNLATSLLATREDLGLRKTRLVAARLEALGFRTRIVERRLTDIDRLMVDDPAVALVGVDNPQTRALLGRPGWGEIVDIGLGAGPADYLDARLHAFPGSRTPEELWSNRRRPFDERMLELPAYAEMERASGDRCGVIMVAGRAVGASFVGAGAAAVALSHLLRYYADDERRFEVVDFSMRNLAATRTALDSSWQGAESLGYVRLVDIDAAR